MKKEKIFHLSLIIIFLNFINLKFDKVNDILLMDKTDFNNIIYFDVGEQITKNSTNYC